MSESERDEIRKTLLGYVSADEGRRLRARLQELAKVLYSPRRTPEQYMEFLNLEFCVFRTCSPQSTNHPFVMEVFCVGAQHQYGDCVEECLDAAMDSIENRKRMES